MSQLKKIVLIDDDEIIVYLTQRIVTESKLGTIIQVFRNGKDAIEYFIENTKKNDLLPDIIFLDLSMPIMDGWEFLKQFKKINAEIEKKITIYVITSSTSSDDLKRALQIDDVKDYLIKPITRLHFIEVIAKS